ncbi:MAG: hypothetical protein LBT70_04190 [Holosporaceae bacterium]|nr:hypothetical protein [Holosporaceae bacterium]
MHNEIFLARTRKNLAQDRSVLPVHEDLSNGFDEVEVEKKPLGNSLLDGFLDPLCFRDHCSVKYFLQK